jgi:hypothetical protein
MRTPLIALLPGALTIYLGYQGGGYFPPATGVACAVLAAALVLRLTLAERPVDGFGLGAAAGAGALGLLAVWTVASSAWSDAPGRAILEFDRVLLYLLAFTLVATLPRTAETARWLLLGLAGAAVAVCLGGLVTRLLPDVLPVELPVLPQRLSYPITYWNGLGLMAVLGIVSATHFAASAREHPALRVAGSALVPLLAATLFFTFSRASIAVAVVAVVAYALVARPRGLPAAALATLPATAVAVKLSYDADLLAKRDPTTAAAADQGHELLAILVLCAVAAAGIRYALLRAGLDRRLERVEVAARTRRLAAGVAAGALALAVLVAFAGFGMGGRIERQYERFKEGDTLAQTDDARQRLTDTANNGRIDHWDKALEAWRDEPVRGTGAGTFELTWARERPNQFTVRDGHSLYLEMLSELGLVGALLLALALAALMSGLAVRVARSGRERALWAALLVTSGAWALHATQDWVWELPALTLWPIAAGAVALAQPARTIVLPRIARVVAALFVLVLAVTPLLSAVAHTRLQDSVTAFRSGNCPAAIEDALAASSALSARAEPYAILGYCDIRLGKLDLAERMMRNAIDRDPRNWEYRYGLALVLAAAGKDPRPEIAEARRLNPLEPLAVLAEEDFAGDDPQKWRRRALEARLPIN